MSTVTNLLVLAIFAQVFLTFIVLFSLATCRFKAAKNQEMDPKFYKLYRGDGEPDHIRQISRNFRNLCEMPVIFILAVILTIVLKLESMLFVYMAWGYVVLRHFHSYVHCTSNKVLLRFRVYLLSIVVLLTYWIMLVVEVLSR